MTDRHAAKIGRVTRWTGWTQWRGSLALCLALCGLELGLSSIARAATFTTFDVPGASTGSGQGTLATSINPAGVITGYYLDASGAFHGFLRAPDGSVTTFDAPGAGAGTDLRQGTFPKSINPSGAITGYYIDAGNVIHGFLRAPDGALTTFDAPGAGAFLGTFAVSINPAGAVAGYYIEYDSVQRSSKTHGLLRDRGRALTVFDAPGSQGLFTFPLSINPAGAITGYYADANSVFHGFLRSR